MVGGLDIAATGTLLIVYNTRIILFIELIHPSLTLSGHVLNAIRETLLEILQLSLALSFWIYLL